MNAFLTSSPFGSTVSPFAYTQCPCNAAASTARNLVGITGRSALVAHDQAGTTLNHAKQIDWEGKAATQFRQRADACARRMSTLAEQIQFTMRLAGSGG